MHAQISKSDTRSILDMYNAYVAAQGLDATAQSLVKAGISTNVEQVRKSAEVTGPGHRGPNKGAVGGQEEAMWPFCLVRVFVVCAFCLFETSHTCKMGPVSSHMQEYAASAASLSAKYFDQDGGFGGNDVMFNQMLAPLS